MPSNKNTTQTPLSGASTKVVLAERVYTKAADSSYSDPSAKLNGTDPTGWTDLGVVMNSKVTLTYTKDIRYVETGIEKVARGAYSMAKTAEFQFVLEQYDLDILTLINGLSVTTVGAIGGKMYLGQDDVVERALLFVGTNKVDGKEHQIYCKKASLTYSIQEQDDARALQVNGRLYAFDPGNGTDAFFVLYVLD